MKIKILSMLLITGLMITACKKDEDSPTPTNNSSRVITIIAKTNDGGIGGNLRKGDLLLNEIMINNIGGGPIDTSITFKNINDSTSLFLGYGVTDSGSFKLIVDGVTRIDTMIYSDNLTFDFRYNYLLSIYP